MKMPDAIWKSSHHAPPHLFVADWVYMITGSTYQRRPIIKSNEQKKEWIDAFLSAAEIYGWKAIAWVVLDTHYHALSKSPCEGAATLPGFVTSYHKYTALRWNKQDKLPGRKVWQNYWDTCIRSEEDLLNRLRYVFWNPVKHGYVDEPGAYPFSNFNDFLDQDWFDIGQFPVEVKNVPEF